MTVRFFVYAENEGALSERLAAAGYPMTRLRDSFEELDWPEADTDGTNNPWKFLDEQGEEIPLGDQAGNRGFGQPFKGDRDKVEEFFAALKDAAKERSDPKIEQSAGVDFAAVPLAVAPNWQHWCAGTGLGRRFGTRAHAERLIGAQRLAAEALTGKGVNIMLIDQGLSSSYVNGLGHGMRFGTDLTAVVVYDGKVRTSGLVDIPFVKTPREHGSMMVRSMLELAPDATIYDIPLIPDRITDVTSFTLFAAMAFRLLRIVLGLQITGKPRFPGPWVIVNAWGIDDRFGESIWGDYTNRSTHPLNVEVALLGEIHDVVFAAGNSGQFCPDPEAGPYDRGPGQSILGANGHPNVSSVGAVRADTHWVGTSSQGPGPADFAVGSAENEKPDFCAPSWFVETHDAALRSGGTSAATAMAAGTIAALREGWPPDTVDPATLRSTLREQARRDWHTAWNGRMGQGILNIPATVDDLTAKFP